jgi:hypothetical protein
MHTKKQRPPEMYTEMSMGSLKPLPTVSNTPTMLAPTLTEV